jgi:hypothetical protein
MKTEIFEIAYPKLGLSNSCVTFNSTKETQKILATHSYGITGICILTLSTGASNVYKFSFSCIGDDGTIDVVSKQFPLDKEIVKSCIVNYAVELILAKTGE